jgi:hypothetical protein
MTTHPFPPCAAVSDVVAPPTPTSDEHVGDEVTAANVVGAATNTEIADEEMTMPRVTKIRRNFPVVMRALALVLSHRESGNLIKRKSMSCHLRHQR